MRRFLALCLLLLASPAFAFEGENLLAELPPGYKIDFQQKKKNSIQITEMVPANESVQNWTEMLTVQVFNGMKGTTPDQFRARMEKLWSGSCANALTRPIATTVEKGYPIAVWMMFCPTNKETGKPESTWFKAIQGQDSFYVVQKAFKFDPSSEQVVKWTLYLKKVAVCDTRVRERACPPGMK